MMDRDEALAAVVDAIKNEGPKPAYHREMMARHRKEWPTLWRALDDLVRVDAPLTPEDAERARRMALGVASLPMPDVDTDAITHHPQRSASAYDIKPHA